MRDMSFLSHPLLSNRTPLSLPLSTSIALPSMQPLFLHFVSLSHTQKMAGKSRERKSSTLSIGSLLLSLSLSLCAPSVVLSYPNAYSSPVDRESFFLSLFIFFSYTLCTNQLLQLLGRHAEMDGTGLERGTNEGDLEQLIRKAQVCD